MPSTQKQTKSKASAKAPQEKMNIVIVGHVDHGKSTVVGRLLADTGSLPEGKLEQVKADCKRNAKPFEYAFLLDALKDEQAQGITIDSARCFFKSKKREYIIIDAPGHIEFLKNMVSGAARAEAALLIIDAKEGIQENSKRHGYLLSMLGINQVAVCVNKMDLVNWDEKVFRKIEKEYRAFLKQIGLTPKFFIPISALNGVNMVPGSSLKGKEWANVDTVLDVLDAFEKSATLDKKPFRMPVQAIYKFTESGDERRIVAGKVEAGTAAVGDKVIFLPSNKRSEIKSIEVFNASAKQRIVAGASSAVTLKEQIYINRGDVMCKLDEPLPLVSTLVKVKIFWMGRQPMVKDKEYKLKLGTAKIPVTLKEIKKVIDASELKKADKNKIERHDVAELVLECSSPIAFDLAGDIEATGRFVIVDQYDIAGGGIITELVKDEQADVREQVLRREEKWDFSIVDPEERRKKYGHLTRLLLLTGKVGVDKKTIAKEVEKALFERGCKTYFLGIGNLLRGLDADMEKHKAARREHVRRLGEVSHILMDAGLIVLATASNLNDEELSLLQEVTSRDAITIINVGKNEFRQGIVDLNLNPKDSAEKNTSKVIELLEAAKIFRPSDSK
ncbi:MAG TPA: GTP-binding protein [Verrucomicrobiae bacterium]|jgi:bifunctional enzyme CysN/CysC|nr:GTP-binding protein [Verrucomicrobiae bacterium]